ncbi:MAG: Npt1/Npt2 family nucleotide transporter [Holophagae bacterium]
MNTASSETSASPADGAHSVGLRQYLVGAAFGIRPGEGALAWLFFFYFLILTTVHFAGKSVRQASFIDVIGAENLPWVYLAVAVVSYPVLMLYSHIAGRMRQAPLVVGLTVLHAAGFVVFYALYGLGRPWVVVLYYIWLGMAFAIAVSQVWSYANHVFDPRQARRLFAFIGAGGLLGAIPGGVVAFAVTRVAGTRATLLASAVLVLVLLVFVLLIERYRPNTHPPPASSRGASVTQARGGFEIIRRSRLLLLITCLMLATVVVGQLVGWQFYWHVEEATAHAVTADRLDLRTSVIGKYFVLMGVVGFLFQLVFTQRIHRALGVGVGMRVLPAAVSAAQAGVVVALVAAPTAVYPLVWVLMLAEGSLRHSVDQATRELLFLPIPSNLRIRSKAFIDVFVQRFAKGMAALLILPVTFALLPPGYVSWLTLVVLIVWLVLTGRVRREYVREYRSGLKAGIIQPDASIDPTDLTTITTLVEGLGSPDPRNVLHSIELLANHGRGHLVPPLLLYHADSEVRARTLRVIADTGRVDAADLVERAVSDDHPDVRSRAMKTLAKLRGGRAEAVMRERLDDPDPDLRATAVAGLLGSADRELADAADRALVNMAADPDPAVRVEAARALGEVDDAIAQPTMIQMLFDSDLNVLRTAVTSIHQRLDRSGANPLYVPTLVSLMGNRRLKHEAREALVAIGDGAVEPLRMFMASSDEQIWVRRAVPKTLALLGTQSAVDALEEHLDAHDTLMRTKIIEALCFMRGRLSEVRFSTRVVRDQVRTEATRYLRCLADLWAISSMHEAHLEGPFAIWQKTDRVPTLPQQLLAQRMNTLVENIFGLLELVERPDDVRAARRSLMSRQPNLRARALEYLDNTLTGALRRDVFAVIDDAPPEEKLRRARIYFNVLMESPEETLDRLIQTDAEADPAARGIILAALHAVWSKEVESLYPLVRRLAESSGEPLVRETAQWVAARAGTVAPGKGVIGRGETSRMAAMANIEMMVFLQGVDLFAHCNAEQVLRLAAIASESQLSRGEVVFRRGEAPDVIFCVVEGRVRLGDDADGGTVVGPSGRFGVLDILSGRPRSGDAIAETDVRLLTIEAEDFFDLLSNNIDIVKALFRSVVSSDAESDEALL